MSTKRRPFSVPWLQLSIALFLLCLPPTCQQEIRPPDIKLVGGFGRNEGTVLLLINSTWGFVCDDGWNLVAAEVACRQAGMGPPLEYTTGNRYRTQVQGRPILLDDVRCTGSEAALTDCRSRPIGTHDCQTDREAAGVRCSLLIRPPAESAAAAAASAWNPLGLPTSDRRLLATLARPSFSLRLAPYGRGDGGGALLASIGGAPEGPVCSDSVSLIDANAVCRHLGRGFGRFVHTFPISELKVDGLTNSSKPVLALGRCYGNETRLEQCAVYGSARGVPCRADQLALGVTCTSDLPDLVPDAPALETSAYISNVPMYYIACALEEKCASPVAFDMQRNDPHWLWTSRVLLRFSSIIANTGTQPFLPLRETHTWEWHLCHMHYHSMAFFASYEVYTRSSSRRARPSSSRRTLASGHKASFCLEDNACNDGVTPHFRCSQDPLARGSQGISPGCKDVYLHDLDCQWVDITELPYGRYAFRVVVNPEYLVAEANWANNAILCDMYYTLNYVRLSACRVVHPFEY